MGGALIIGSASILSRFFGLLRDNLFARYYGASATLDVYNAAFKIPDFIFNILVLGALFAAFIPVFLEFWNKDKEEAWNMVSSVLNFLLIGLAILGGLAFIFAPAIMRILVKDWAPDLQMQAAHFMRVMLISMIFFAISNIFSGVLNAFRRFTSYAIAPIFYNIGIIIGILFFTKIFGDIGLAYGVVFGAFLHFVIQIPAVIKTGFKWRWYLNWKDTGTRKILKLMIPRSLALGLTQINLLVMTTIISTLPTGSLTIWSWADNLQHFPINVFGVSLALSAFPVFSQAFIEQNQEKFKTAFSESFRKIMFFIIPISVAILLLRAQFVRLILGMGAGQFDWPATISTAQTLGFFSISLFAQASIPLLARSFFAQQNTKTPVISSIIALVVNTVLALLLVKPMGLFGLALAFSIAELTDMLILLGALRVKVGYLDDQRIINSTMRIVITSLVMGVAIQMAKYLIAPVVDMRSYIGIFMQTMGALAAGGVVYTLIATYWGFSEVQIVKLWIRRAKNQLFNGAKKNA